MDIIGEIEKKSFIILKNVPRSHENEILLYQPHYLTLRSSQLLLKRRITKKISQASLQQLSTSASSTQSLLALVYEELGPSESKSFTANLFLLENINQNFNDSPNPEKFASIIILEEIPLVKEQSNELRVHILPPNPPESYSSMTLGPDTPGVPTPVGGLPQLAIFRTQVIALSLEECITVYEIETTLSSSAEAKIEIISSDFIPKCFWWCQWIPDGKFLAFAHSRQAQQSSIDENLIPDVLVMKPILSVFQFHGNLPRETVLNIPLDEEISRRPSSVLNMEPTKINENMKKRSNSVKRFPLDNQELVVTLTPRPTVLNSKMNTFPNFRVLAQSSGEVYLFQILPPSILPESFDLSSCHGSSFSYKVNLLHHNKSLKVTTVVDTDISTNISVDICLFQNGQFLAVLGYPHFLHLLDVGIGHEPSHHLIFDWSSLSINSPIRTHLLMSTDSESTNNNRSFYTITFTSHNLCKTDVEINSTFLIPLLLQMKRPDFNFSLAVLHYLLIHLSDVNAVKKILYEMARSLSNPHLTDVFQEFIIANSFLLTKKQLMTNMKIFLNFLPYSSLISTKNSSTTIIQTNKYLIELIQNGDQVSTMLLSPRQRILPHTVTDIWTRLWEISSTLAKSTRFCHRSIAQKLLVSFQCYQPEALSRVTTPMSPSSPMVCNSLGDIAALFGRRTSELQLPFVEHESCTANKQEYVYSINLRELSTHLLKERRDWPLHGQTVAGKYMGALVDSARLLCHLICLTLHLQPTKNNKNKGFNLM